MIRRFKEDEKNLFVELVTEFYHSDGVLHTIPVSHMEATFNEMIQSDRYVEGFLLRVEDQPAGYGLISKSFSQECGGPVIWFEELYIRESYRGCGLGSQFFQYVEEQFPKTARFRLEVEPDNEGAARLYQRLGYESLPYNQMIKENHK